jgi:alginate O-acetyltransferase complex protein AlgI
MVFTSHFFIFYFLPFVLTVYYALPRRWKNLFLTLASYLFYGWFKPWYVSLMLVSTVVDYFCARTISKEGQAQSRRKAALIMSIIVNLGLLGVFKYYVFAASNLSWLLQTFGHGGFQVMSVVLPIGISFYTFQTMSYTIDVYRGHAHPVRSIFDFSCFVALFPQLIAGPIIRYNTVEEQLRERTHTVDRFTRGILLFMLGFSKKILLANPCGEIADAAFGAGAPMALQAWMGVTAYAFQIYFDFCGYSDMAVGLGRMFGFEFIKNFDAPYRSKSFTEFWRRWHISLSTWLRDYLYIPLGGNKKGANRTYLNLMIVMLLGGFWHGANWQFILWGAYHGVLLALERLIGKRSFYSRLPGVFQILITFTLTLFAWVFFRAENLTLAWRYFGAMFGLIPASAAALLLDMKIHTPYLLFMFGLSAFLVFQKRQAMDWVEQVNFGKGLLVIFLFILALAMMFTQAFNPFLYFQF